MRRRQGVVEFIRNQMRDNNRHCRAKEAIGYGYQELRELLDFIYEGPPKENYERLVKVDIIEEDKKKREG